MSDENKRAPVQGWAAGIPWELHLEAYSAYCKKYGPQQALIEGGCRGGFHTSELDDFIRGWRERASVLTAALARVDALTKERDDYILKQEVWEAANLELRSEHIRINREILRLATENARLVALINTPHTNSFLDAVRLEAAHQRERWAAAHDAGKSDADWFWLIGYLAGKAISKPEKLLHHIVTTAAACLNWHMARTVGNDMRPGIAPSETSGEKEA